MAWLAYRADMRIKTIDFGKRVRNHYLYLANTVELGKIFAQPHTIVKQICFPNGDVLFLSLSSLSKNWMHNVGWGCAEILPKAGPIYNPYYSYFYWCLFIKSNLKHK